MPALNPGIDDPITIVFFDLLLKYGMRRAQLDSECRRARRRTALNPEGGERETRIRFADFA